MRVSNRSFERLTPVNSTALARTFQPRGPQSARQSPTDACVLCRQVAVYRPRPLFRPSSLQPRWGGPRLCPTCPACPAWAVRQQPAARQADQQRQVVTQELAGGAQLGAQGDRVAAPLGRERLTQPQAQAAAVGAPLVARALVMAALLAQKVLPAALRVVHGRSSPDVSALEAPPPAPVEPPVRVA